MTPIDREALRRAEAELPPAPWKVWTSCSFRRITGPDGKDGGVLHAYNQRPDSHPDLSMPEEQLEALTGLRNAFPAILTALETAEAETKETRTAIWKLRESNCHLTSQLETAEDRIKELETADAEIPDNDRLQFIGGVGRKVKIGKHQAVNYAQLKQTVEALYAAGFPTAADTIIWLVWFRILDHNREEFLIADANERRDAAEAKIAEQAEIIDRLNTRLENNAVWRSVNDGPLERVAVEPGSIPDGIDCRDETIRQQDERLTRQAERIAELEGAITRMISPHTPSPGFPGGHIHQADCDRCHYAEIGQRALARAREEATDA